MRGRRHVLLFSVLILVKVTFYYPLSVRGSVSFSSLNRRTEQRKNPCLLEVHTQTRGSKALRWHFRDISWVCQAKRNLGQPFLFHHRIQISSNFGAGSPIISLFPPPRPCLDKIKINKGAFKFNSVENLKTATRTLKSFEALEDDGTHSRAEVAPFFFSAVNVWGDGVCGGVPVRSCVRKGSLPSQTPLYCYCFYLSLLDGALRWGTP